MRGHGPKLFGDWRDFLREFVIIVLGVLTALLAQSVVEDLSWRQKVHAATDDMRQELGSGNGPQNYVRLMMTQCFNDRLAAVKQAVEAGDRPASLQWIKTLWLPVGTYDNYAWENAVSSEISTHIPQREKYEFRIAYVMVPELDTVRAKMLGEFATLRSIPGDGGSLSQAEKQIALEAIANLEMDDHRMERASSITLRLMKNLGIGLNRDQLHRRIAEANMHYTGCLTTDGNKLRAMITGEIFDPNLVNPT
jgi:hypothetical protein